MFSRVKEVAVAPNCSGAVWFARPSTVRFVFYQICIERQRRMKQDIKDLREHAWCLNDAFPPRGDGDQFETPFHPRDPLTRLVAGAEEGMVHEALRRVFGLPETRTYTMHYDSRNGNYCSPLSPNAIEVEETRPFLMVQYPKPGSFTTALLRQKLDEMVDDPRCAHEILEFGKVEHLAVSVRHSIDDLCPITHRS